MVEYVHEVWENRRIKYPVSTMKSAKVPTADTHLTFTPTQGPIANCRLPALGYHKVPTVFRVSLVGPASLRTLWCRAVRCSSTRSRWVKCENALRLDYWPTSSSRVIDIPTPRSSKCGISVVIVYRFQLLALCPPAAKMSLARPIPEMEIMQVPITCSRSKRPSYVSSRGVPINLLVSKSFDRNSSSNRRVYYLLIEGGFYRNDLIKMNINRNRILSSYFSSMQRVIEIMQGDRNGFSHTTVILSSNVHETTCTSTTHVSSRHSIPAWG